MDNNVLIFDDEIKFANKISDKLNNFNCTIITSPKQWTKEVLDNNKFDCIIVDVKILGFELSGPEYAIRTIQNNYLSTPIIVVTGVVKLPILKNKYGKKFYDYVDKSERKLDRLLKLVTTACTLEGRRKHNRNMLKSFARTSYKALNIPYLSADMRDHLQSHKQLAASIHGDTIKDAIENIPNLPTKNDYQMITRSFFKIMEDYFRYA